MISADTTPAPAPEPRQRPSLQLVVRRVHLYLGLALVPWVLMYALSTMVMNHRAAFQARSAGTPSYSLERQLDYSRTFSTNTPVATVAQLILEDIGLAGAHRVSAGTGGRPLIIERHHPLGHYRITWKADIGRLTIDRETFHARTALERLHRRRGFHHAYLLEDAWATAVDLTLVGLLFWGLSGLWFWWSMPDTRVAGAICLALGLGLFLVFLLRL